MLDFLVELYETNIGYSAMNTARCALSTIIMLDNVTIGSHPLVIRFLKGVYNTRPPIAKHSRTWDVSIVLRYLKSLSPARHLSLKSLTFKVVTLLALVSAQRAQTLHILKCTNMTISKDLVVFHIDSTVKHSRPGKSLQPIELKAYHRDKRLCIVHYLNYYLRRTSPIRGNHSKLFLSFHRPYKPVSKDTISRWIKFTLHEAGVPQHYTAHSTRSASTSAVAQQLPIDVILKTAQWSNQRSFDLFYNKPVESDFATTLLQHAN